MTLPELAQHDGSSPSPVLDASTVREWMLPEVGETCDRCPAAAIAAVHLEHGCLVFCGHHGRQYLPVLQARGAVVVGDLVLPAQPSSPA